MFFGRRQHTALPTLPIHHLLIDLDSAIDARNAIADRSKTIYDKQAHSLSLLPIGQEVILQDPISHLWNRECVIAGVRDGGLSYTVAHNGKTYIRNRRFLRPIGESLSRPAPSTTLPDPPPLRRSARVGSRQRDFANLKKPANKYYQSLLI
eukprot:snap_masked-scaffold1586_size34850-processed-gene-0.2 protein:Tk08332 transcript:snap_masked-scaffold1586_size34850-processed-gene-0.2-mRNA-1 annotation:"hypothetical protein DAPPUDRAFT_256239"